MSALMDKINVSVDGQFQCQRQFLLT